MKNKTKINLALGMVGAALLGSLFLAGTAFADQGEQGQGDTHAGVSVGAGIGIGLGMRAGIDMRGVVGTVSAINSTTLTVTSKAFGSDNEGNENSTSSVKTFTVDASSATVSKNGASSTVSAIAVGDTVMVKGTVSGSNVTATAIVDGMLKMPSFGKGLGHGTSTPPVIPQGNGEPVIGGNVTAISGSTLTVTNKSNVTYTVNAASSTVLVKGKTSTLTAVAVGDNVLVQGAINGTSVTASSVFDQGAPKTPGNATSTPGQGEGMGKAVGGFFGGIGNFFHRLFGFF